ncbi:unnamed protein product [Ectocarpus sp. 6 AP-2014]
MKATLATTALFCVGAANAFFAPTAFTGQQLTAGTSAPSRTTTGVTMKIFDWKRRESEDGLVLDRVAVDTLKPAPGSRQRHKRKGRGIAAGQGASCGFGMRGQKSRSGPGVRAGFEGGQQPLYRRLPKLVGRPMGPGHTKKQFNLIKLDALNGLDEGATVNFESLRAAGKVTKTKHRWHKVVGGMELETTGLTVQAHGFTKSAVEAIEAKGGKCELLSPTTNEVLSMDEEEEEE